MVKFKFTEADTEKYKRWVSFYPKRQKQSPFQIKFTPYWYFEPRPMVLFNITSVIGLILPFISLWFLPLFVLSLFYGWGQVFLSLPYDSGKGDTAEYPEYGVHTFSFDETFPSEICFLWGKKRKYVSFPWAFEWYRTSIMDKYGSWMEEKRGQRLNHHEKEYKIWKATFPYTYTLKSGNKQHVNATVSIEEREWRRKWLMWTTLFNKVHRSIDINFSKEVGEGIGSWKGGTIGCSYEMKKGETPYQTLQRMEKERTFN